MTLAEMQKHFRAIADAPKPDFILVGKWQIAAIWVALGYKAWIESKGKRGHRPPREWIES